MMTANDFRFGVEIEFTGAMTDEVATSMDAALSESGIRVVLERYNHQTRGHWKVTTDATVSRGYSMRTGVGEGGELVSPVLEGEAGLEQLRVVLDALNAVPGVRVDRRCGVHVHLSWADMNEDWIANIIDRYTRHEAEIDRFVAPSRRGSVSRWCGAMAPVKTAVDNAKAMRRMSRAYLALAPRYHKVNLQSLTSHGTVEFRQHQGSTDYMKISNWIRFLMGFVDSSRDYTEGGRIEPQLNIRGQSRRAYGEIRYQFEQAGFTMNYAGGRRWHLCNEGGEVVAVLYNDQLDACYAYRRRLNHDFIRLFTQIVESASTPQSDDDVFNGVPAETVAFLNQRVAELAA
jgi:hypothetical protein